MKRYTIVCSSLILAFFLILTTLILLLLPTSPRYEPQTWITGLSEEDNRAYVDDFLKIAHPYDWDNPEGYESHCEHNHVIGSESSNSTSHLEHYVHVTPPSILEQTDVRIFRRDCDGRSYFLLEEEICEVAGYQLLSAVPWDYNRDGHVDILYTVPTGSGFPCHDICVFDTNSKENIRLDAVYDFASLNGEAYCVLVSEYDTLTGKKIGVFLGYEDTESTVHADGSISRHYSRITIETKTRIGTVAVKDGTPYIKRERNNIEWADLDKE